MRDFVWDKPVTIGSGGNLRSLRGPRDALACLSDHPSLKGPFARKAHAVCIRALRHGRDVGRARQAIVAAMLACAVPFA